MGGRLSGAASGPQPVILWRLLLQPVEKAASVVPEDPWPLVLKPFFLSPQDLFDKTKTGRIDVYGFSALWKFIQQWKNLFQQYDRDHSGSISYTELQQGEGLAGPRCTGRAGPFSLLPEMEQGVLSGSDYQIIPLHWECCPQHGPTPHPFCGLAGQGARNAWLQDQSWTLVMGFQAA